MDQENAVEDGRACANQEGCLLLHEAGADVHVMK
jgi:hypothetical protein